MQPNMSNMPFVLWAASASRAHGPRPFEPTADEVTLPPVVSLDAEGFALARWTKLTKVEEETTDDD